ncbi:hypothetical protein [Natronohydrobacter thiooxidans]|uniref:hypothetical protein n=1 Tax=Natronohydrobacter thiooxidans TaxID=87172 RepID=UPI0008FF712B|nr:hypothetical protein [Natronohydrobacter thiooxidans]
MKPNFALGLTDDGITLWQRDATGWLRVGAVAPEAADLAAQMQGLVKIASALAPEGVRTKLVVPDEQILFCDLPVSARNRDMQSHEIRAQLAGRTPYPVEELDFDWTVSDGMAHVAVVARETLVEAEDFARGFGLNPISSVASPANGSFPQEPFFGPTRGARAIIGDVSQLERDSALLRETGIARLPEPELKQPEPEPKPQVDPEVTPDQAAEPEAPRISGSAPAPVARSEAEAEAEAKPEKQPKSGPEAAAKTQDPAPKKSETGKEKKASLEAAKSATADAQATGKDGPETAEKKAGRPADAKGDAKAAAPAPAASTTEPPAGKVGDRVSTGSPSGDAQKSSLIAKLRAAKAASESRKAAAGPLTGGMSALGRARQKLTDVLPSKQSSVNADAEPVQAASGTGEGAVAFRSRRASAPVPGATPTEAQAPKPASDLLGSWRAKLSGAQDLSKRTFGGLSKADGTPPAETSQRRAVPTEPAPKAEKTGTPANGKSKSKPAAEAKSPAPVKMSSGAATTGRKDPLETLQARAGGKSPPPSNEAERLTIFGARGQAENTGAAPRRALLVLVGLGLILVAVAIWVVYFLNTGPVTTEVSEQADPPAASAPLVTGQAEPETVLPESLEDIEAALGLEDAAQQLPLDAPEPAPLDDPVHQADAVSGDAPVTESEQPAGRVAGVRSSALLAPQDHLPLPDAPSAPAPFGAEPLPPLRSEVEQAALAQAEAPDPAAEAAPDAETQTGPSLPEGEEALEIDVTEGTPAVVPPARPEGLAPETEAAVEAALEAATLEAAAEAVIAGDATDAPEAGIAAEDLAESLAMPDPAADPLDESGLEIVVTEGRPAVVPPARPEGLAPEQAAPEPAAADADSEALAPPTTDESHPDPSADQAELDTPPPGGVALTALRPAARPSMVAELAEAARAAEAEPVFDATELAVAASARPTARPGQFAAVVQRALRAAQPRSTTQTPAAVAAAPAPEAQAPVQTARAAVPAAPPIPSSASVAREATQARAINLRQINLIGVMGTSSSRRALVRLSNGRVVTVRVGDSLDNGSVTAISENELRYSRRGRDVVLRIAS